MRLEKDKYEATRWLGTALVLGVLRDFCGEHSGANSETRTSGSFPHPREPGGYAPPA